MENSLIPSDIEPRLREMEKLNNFLNFEILLNINIYINYESVFNIMDAFLIKSFISINSLIGYSY